MRRSQRQEDEESRVLCELSAMVLNMLRSPMSLSDGPSPSLPPRRLTPEITPAGFASLLLGISVTLMVCGSVTFFIGFVLMPWVIGLVMVLYVAGVVSFLSSILGCVTPRKDVPVPVPVPEWKLL